MRKTRNFVNQFVSSSIFRASSYLAELLCTHPHNVISRTERMEVRERFHSALSQHFRENEERTTSHLFVLQLAQMETHGPLYLLLICITIMAAWFSGDTKIRPDPKFFLYESSLSKFPFSFENHVGHLQQSTSHATEQDDMKLPLMDRELSELDLNDKLIKTTLQTLVRKYRYSKLTPKRDTLWFIQTWVLLRVGSVVYALIPFIVRIVQRKPLLTFQPIVAIVAFVCNLVLAFLLQYFIQYAFFHDLTQYHRVLEDITDLIEPTPYDIFPEESHRFEEADQSPCSHCSCCRSTSVCFMTRSAETQVSKQGVSFCLHQHKSGFLSKYKTTFFLPVAGVWLFRPKTKTTQPKQNTSFPTLHNTVIPQQRLSLLVWNSPHKRPSSGQRCVRAKCTTPFLPGRMVNA